MSSGPHSFPHHSFAPSDDELISVFLTGRIFDELPKGNKIQTVPDIYRYTPGRLIENYKKHGEPEQIWYFFNKRNKNQANRKVKEDNTHKTGSWHQTLRAPIGRGGHVVIGWKRIFDFYEGDVKEGKKTGYVMEEFEADETFLSNSRHKNINSSKSSATSKANEESTIWVLSKIFLRSSSTTTTSSSSTSSSGEKGKRTRH